MNKKFALFGALALSAGLLASTAGPVSAEAENGDGYGWLPACTIFTDGPGVTFGTADDDVICGDDSNNIIYALGGNDLVYSMGGNDVVFLGDGEDVAFLGMGNDRGYGGNGDDLIVGGFGDDQLWGQNGDDVLDGFGKRLNEAAAASSDVNGSYFYIGVDRAFGGNGDDLCFAAITQTCEDDFIVLQAT